MAQRTLKLFGTNYIVEKYENRIFITDKEDILISYELRQPYEDIPMEDGMAIAYLEDLVFDWTRLQP